MAAVTQVCFGLTQTAWRQNRPQKSTRSSSMLLQRCSIYSEEQPVLTCMKAAIYMYIYTHIYIFFNFFFFYG